MISSHHQRQPPTCRYRIALLPSAHCNGTLANVISERRRTRPKANYRGESIHSADDTVCTGLIQYISYRTDYVATATMRTMLKTAHDRLRHARTAAGYKTAADFAAAIGVQDGTYRHHENGIRGLSPNAAKRYASHLGVSATWLMFGEDNVPTNDLIEIIEDFSVLPPDDQADIRDLIRRRAQRARGVATRGT